VAMTLPVAPRGGVGMCARVAPHLTR
jgi:hypothetical protein